MEDILKKLFFEVLVLNIALYLTSKYCIVPDQFLHLTNLCSQLISAQLKHPLESIDQNESLDKYKLYIPICQIYRCLRKIYI